MQIIKSIFVFFLSLITLHSSAKVVDVNINAAGLLTGFYDLSADFRLNEKLTLGIGVGDYNEGLFSLDLLDSFGGTGYGGRINYHLTGTAFDQSGWAATARYKYYPKIEITDRTLFSSDTDGEYNAHNIFIGAGYLVYSQSKILTIKLFAGFDYWTNDDRIDSDRANTTLEAPDSGAGFELEFLIGVLF